MFSVQCLLLGLHGYLIRFAPLAFIPYCQNCPRNVPSLLLVRSRLTILPLIRTYSLRLPVSSEAVLLARPIFEI